MSDFPMMLYRNGCEFLWDGRPCDTLMVHDEEQAEQALSEGWMESADYLATPFDVEAPASAPDALGKTKELQAKLTEAEDLMRAALEENDALKARAEKAEARAAELEALVAKFDGDKDGKPGGSSKGK